MLLITVNEWFGYSRFCADRIKAEAFKPEKTEVVFLTHLPISQALTRISTYETAFKDKYGAFAPIVEYTLVNITTIPDLDEDSIELTRLRLVEKLPQTTQGF